MPRNYLLACSAGIGGMRHPRHGAPTSNVFQDRSHQYVEIKGGHPWTEPNTNPFGPFGKRGNGEPAGCAAGLPTAMLQQGDTDRDGKVTVLVRPQDRLCNSRRTMFFLRTEATNILKRNEDNTGPNPIRTHLRKRDKAGAMRIPEEQRKRALGELDARYYARELGSSRYIFKGLVGYRSSRQAVTLNCPAHSRDCWKEKRIALSDTSQVGNMARWRLAFYAASALDRGAAREDWEKLKTRAIEATTSLCRTPRRRSALAGSEL